MSTIAVIGAGLFGSIIAKKLRADGHSVAIIDDERPGSGSKPAACLMKPSWFSGLGPKIYDPALELLNDLYTVNEVQFKVGPAKVSGVYYCNPQHVLSRPNMVATVQKIRGDHLVCTHDGVAGLVEFRFDHCIVAAGVWSRDLVDVPGLQGQAGISCIWDTPDCFNFEPFISPWAPYRQLVAFQRQPTELWVGDGTAIKMENWTDERQEVSVNRCMKAVGMDRPHRIEFGIRPQIKGIKHAYVKQLSPTIWVATGGAKNGTLGAAWAAHELSRALA